MKKIKLVCAGFGGQGVLTVGQLVAMMAMNRSLLVSWMPSYGPEMRGGTANCHVVIDDYDIGSPIIASEITHLLAMNQPALLKFLPKVASGGFVIVNSSINIPEDLRSDIQWISYNFYDIAQQAGSLKAQNMAAFGALVKNMPPFEYDEGLDVIVEKFGFKNEEMVAINQRAYTLAYQSNQIEI